MQHLENVSKYYKSGKQLNLILNRVNLYIDNGEFLAITGPSGSGKSTLLNIMGLLDFSYEGQYSINNQSAIGLSETQAAKLRNRLIGFIFQSFHLIPFKTAIDNISLPLFYQKIPYRKRSKIAMEYLIRLGLKNKALHYPAQLSGGEQQRIAIARAMVTHPEVILADEPTGALDSGNGIEILKLFKEINQSGVTVIIVTHDKEIAQLCERIITLRDGVIVG